MGILYKRQESNEKTTIIFKYYPVFYLFIFVLFILGAFQLIPQSYFYAIGLTGFIIFILAFLKPTLEIKKAMKDREVTFKGSKLSFKNPLTVTYSNPSTSKNTDNKIKS